MDQITEQLYLGDLQDGMRAAMGRRGAIDAVVNLTEATYSNMLLYCHMPLRDEMIHPPAFWDRRVAHIQWMLQTGYTVLIHCRLGKSRSPAVTAAVLAANRMHSDPQTALAYVRTQRACVDVHPDTWQGVIAWWAGRASCDC